MIFREIMGVSVNHKKHNYTVRQNDKILKITADGTYNYHWVLKG